MDASCASHQVEAAGYNLVNGEYVYITVEPLPNFPPYGTLNPVLGDNKDQVTRRQHR